MLHLVSSFDREDNGLILFFPLDALILNVSSHNTSLIVSNMQR